MNLTELDALMGSIEMPIRPETLEEAWDLAEQYDRTPHVLLLVTMLVKPGFEAQLAEASQTFVVMTSSRSGSLGSTLHQSPDDPQTSYLLERFANEEALARHMASDYFADFRAVQTTVLAGPVEAIFLERGTLGR